jgi:hypothetical protein
MLKFQVPFASIVPSTPEIITRVSGPRSCELRSIDSQLNVFNVSFMCPWPIIFCVCHHHDRGAGIPAGLMVVLPSRSFEIDLGGDWEWIVNPHVLLASVVAATP